MAFQVLLQPTSKPYSGMYHKQTNKNNLKKGQNDYHTKI